MKIKLSQKQWNLIGKRAGWIPRDPTDISDEDLGPIMTPDEEEEILLGPIEEISDEEMLIEAYKKGYKDVETLLKESLKYLTGNANDS